MAVAYLAAPLLPVKVAPRPKLVEHAGNLLTSPASAARGGRPPISTMQVFLAHPAGSRELSVLVNEDRVSHCRGGGRAERSNLPTQSAPGSWLRIALTAEVSRTSRDASTTAPSLVPPVLQEPGYRAPFARSAKCADGIIGNRD